MTGVCMMEEQLSWLVCNGGRIAIMTGVCVMEEQLSWLVCDRGRNSLSCPDSQGAMCVVNVHEYMQTRLTDVHVHYCCELVQYSTLQDPRPFLPHYSRSWESYEVLTLYTCLQFLPLSLSRFHNIPITRLYACLWRSVCVCVWGGGGGGIVSCKICWYSYT